MEENQTQNTPSQHKSRKGKAIVIIITTIYILGVLSMSAIKHSFPFQTSKRISNSTSVTITSTTSPSPTPDKLFAIAEIQSHNTRESCFIAYRNKVYDITTFIDKHPGHPGMPAEECGMVTDEFSDKTHAIGPFSQKMIMDVLNPLYIGHLESSTPIK